MKLLISILLLFTGLIFPQNINCQKSSEESSQNISIKRQKDHEELAIDFSEVSKLKIFIHKSTFRSDEMFPINVGLLTSDKDYYYFPKYNDELDIFIKDRSGKKIKIEPIFSFDRFMKFEKHKDNILTYSVNLIVGCEGNALKRYEQDFKLVDEDDLKDAFNRNLFWRIPDGCVDIKDTSEVEIFAELSNSLVVYDKNNPSFKTATGKIKSNILKAKFIQE